MLGSISNSLFAGVYAWFDLQFPVCRGLCLVRSPIPCLQRICASFLAWFNPRVPLFAEALASVFEGLKFTVQCHNDVSAADMTRLMHDMARLDHSDYDCFICCILTHGRLGEVFGSDGVSVEIRDLTAALKPSSCPSLAGKPKLFFMQACQGEKTQVGEALWATCCVEQFSLRNCLVVVVVVVVEQFNHRHCFVVVVVEVQSQSLLCCCCFCCCCC